VQHALFNSPAATLTPPEGAGMGILYVAATLVYVAGSVVGLLARYRNVS